ncbi:MAG: sigma 54-interacting transcriptional regulator [Myxococcota bacterium]
MIGLLDLGGQGLIRAALEESGAPLMRLDRSEDVLRELRRGTLSALILEAGRLTPELFDLLAAGSAVDLPALVVARDRTVSAAVEALRAGASDYLAVPFELECLLRAVERLIGESCVAGDPQPAAEPFVTQDPEVRATLDLLRSVASSDATILIEGESGTGKELMAQLVHRASPRRARELISLNCAALPEGLLESELFGHERGAFTGALSRVIGKFELADGTTILLDEIGELALPLQAKLLRVLQEKQVQRIGARRPVSVDFRLVATTNRELTAEVRTGRFREDLYYRLNVLPVRIKPLRERPDDIPLLVEHFTQRQSRAGRPSPRFSEATLEALRRHDWPGNVRELQNLIERLSLVRGGREVAPSDLGLAEVGTSRMTHGASAAPPELGTLREMERWLIVETLKHRRGNRTQAARDLAISLRTLRNKINEYRIDEPDTLPRTGIATRPRQIPGARGSADSSRAEAAG